MKVKIKGNLLDSDSKDELVESTTWRSYNKETVLHKLIEQNRFDDFSLVLEEDRKINRLIGDSLIHIPDECLVYPLHLALTMPDRENFIDLLLKNGANLRVKDQEGKTCYHYQKLSGKTKFDFTNPSDWIVVNKGKSNKKDKLLLYVCETFGNKEIKIAREKLTETKLSAVKIYYKNTSTEPITEDLDFNLIVGEISTMTDYYFEKYL